jgi:protein-S-isoprenylcysteine O-methyltransferase Ste14
VSPTFPWVWLALAYHVASRLAYVLYVGITLRRQDRAGIYGQRYGPEAGFRRFRRIAATVMNNDAVSFVVLCVVAWNSPPIGLPRGWEVGVGLFLIFTGVAIKLWAGATLGWDAYYWRNFFTPPARLVPNTTGPYRFLWNPMYTVGYFHLYGLALVAGSQLALLAALFDQVAILAFYWWVERPHLDRLRSAAQRAGVPGSGNMGASRPPS